MKEKSPRNIGGHAGSIRLRARNQRSFELTFIAPGLDFYARLKSWDTDRQEIVTVRGTHWSQLEVERTRGFFGRPDTRTILKSVPAGHGAIEVLWSEFAGSALEISTATTIGHRGEISWQSSGRGGIGLGAGRAMDGSGSGVDSLGQPYTYTTAGNQTKTVTQLDGGGTRTVVTTDTSWDTRATWQTKDSSGATVGSGSYTQDKGTGSWSKSTSSSDGAGGTITTNSSGTSDSSTSEKVHLDAGGNVVESERSVETKAADGTSSKVTSSVDGASGEVTIETVSKDAGGTEYTHVTVSDAAGNTIRDETTVTPGPGGGPSGGTSGDAPGDTGGGQPSGGGPDNSGGGQPSGGGPDNSGGGQPSGGGPDNPGGGSDDAPDDDRTGSGKGAYPGAGGHDGPHFPGGSLGSVFNDLGVTSGGGDDWGESTGHGIIATRLRRIVVAGFDAPDSPESGDNSGGGEGDVVVDVVVPAPPGAVDDWGDRPNPRAMTAITALLLNYGVSLSAAAGQLRQMSKGLV